MEIKRRGLGRIARGCLLICVVPFILSCRSVKDDPDASGDSGSGGGSPVNLGCAVNVLNASGGMALYKEHVKINRKALRSCGVTVGQQIRLIIGDSPKKYALYTVIETHNDSASAPNVWMGDTGLERLGRSSGFQGYISKKTIDYTLKETELRGADEFGCFLSETSATHTKLIVGSPHGGGIEYKTDREAKWFYSRVSAHHQKSVSAWYCMGWQSALGSNFKAWHITSTEISRKSFLKLDQVASRKFTYAVSFHGHSGSEILIGGGAPEALKNEVKAAIDGVVPASYTITVLTHASQTYSGMDPKNFVNWLTTTGSNGIQIEQPYSARKNYGKKIAEAVADLFAGKI